MRGWWQQLHFRQGIPYGRRSAKGSVSPATKRPEQPLEVPGTGGDGRGRSRKAGACGRRRQRCNRGGAADHEGAAAPAAAGDQSVPGATVAVLRPLTLSGRSRCGVRSVECELTGVGLLA